MANITARKNKSGEIVSYRIRVSKGYDCKGNKLKPYEMTWKPEKKYTAKQLEKELQKVAALFEEKCRLGLAGDSKQKFEDYAEYVINLKVQSGELKHHTEIRYRELLKRINQGIGFIKLCDIRPQHLNALYEQLSQNGLRRKSEKAILKDAETLCKLISKSGYTSKEKFAKEGAGVSCTTLRKSLKGEKINIEIADKISKALKQDTSKLFTIEKDERPLSTKTVREHHMLIHLILKQANCEDLIINNPADKAKPPKAEKTKANYFEQNEITDILQAAEQIPLKWKTIIHLLIVTGGRRGEVLGLTWDNIDFNFNRIHIEKCVYYEADTGIYIDKPKTESSIRYIRLPEETMQLLKQYKEDYYEPIQEACSLSPEGFLFIKDSGKDIGSPMHPDSITSYCNTFSERFGLKHINPHAFRHTAASLLYFAGLDTITISNRLGHAKPSTTQDIYAHVIAEADSRAADCMGDIILSTHLNRSNNTKQKKTV